MLTTISELNSLNFEDFISKIGNVVEHCPVLAAALWKYRPFLSLEDLMNKMKEIIQSLPLSVQEGILRVHPDLAGRLATNGQLTKESSSEQSQANLNQLTPEEKATLAHLNDNYKSKFGFPFVICARLNKKEAIMVGLQRRLNHSSDIEVKNGIAEVLKICELRLKDIVKNC
eukprot:10085.XXX_5770_5184_1 [CDS] Oithona nana genome sequencing.